MWLFQLFVHFNNISGSAFHDYLLVVTAFDQSEFSVYTFNIGIYVYLEKKDSWEPVEVTLLGHLQKYKYLQDDTRQHRMFSRKKDVVPVFRQLH
jgi:hypothetical protein